MVRQGTLRAVRSSPSRGGGARPVGGGVRRPAERLRLLREVAGLDHVQIDDFQWACEPDASGPDFFLYDLSWAGFARGDLKLEEIQQETGIEVSRLDDLR